MACPSRSSLLGALLPVAALALLAPGPARRSDASSMPGMPEALVASIPPRDASAPTGSQVVAGLSSASPAERSRAFCEQILRGNVPSALRRLRPVEMSVPDPHGAPVRAVVWVMPDYLAVGSDEDFVRVPLGLPGGPHRRPRFGFTLPTRKIVNSIHRQAEGEARTEADARRAGDDLGRLPLGAQPDHRGAAPPPAAGHARLRGPRRTS